MPDVGSVPPATAAAPHVATTVLVRSAGLPVHVLDDLEAPRTTASLREAEQLTRRAADLNDSLSDDLHRIVPLTMDPTVRHAAVRLRRDIHNGRWSRSVADAADRVLPRLPPEAAERLRQWCSAALQRQERIDEAAETLPEELRTAADALWRHLRTPAVARGLALASYDFTRRLLSSPAPARPGSRYARSATSYLTRTAVKTSPFSTLTTVGAATLAGRAPGDRPRSSDDASGAAPLRQISSNRAVAVALLLACSQAPQTATVPDVVAVSGLRSVDGRRLAVLPTPVVRNGSAFRIDELTDCGGYEWLLDALPDRPVPLDELMAAAWSGADPDLVRRLLAIGLLQPVLPWQPGTGRHFEALAAQVRARAEPSASEEPSAPPASFTDAVDRLAELESVVAGSPDANERAVAVEATREAAREAFSRLGKPAPRWLADLPLFHETTASPSDAGPALAAPVVADLADAARWLVPLTVRHPYYDRMVRWFVRRYGAGAAGVDLLEFLYRCLDAQEPNVTSPASEPIEEHLSRNPQRLRGHGTLSPATYTIFCQVVAPDTDSIARGEHRTVVNMVHTGSTGQITRWTHVPALHDALGAPLTEWIRGRHPGCRIYQFSCSADWSDMQRPGLTSLPRLRCPGDLLDRGGAATELTGMTLAHDTASGTLQAYDCDGAPAAFTYLGTVPDHLLAGPSRLLSLLSDPWILLGRVDRDRRVLDDEPDCPDGGSFQPRIERGRIIWARARWTFRPDDVPRPEAKEQPTAFLSRVTRWKEHHGLPDEVFVTRIRRGPGGVMKDKPQWLGFAHPHTAWAALGVLPGDVSVIDVTEALPAHREHWARNTDDERIATELVGLVGYA